MSILNNRIIRLGSEVSEERVNEIIDYVIRLKTCQKHVNILLNMVNVHLKIVGLPTH